MLGLLLVGCDERDAALAPRAEPAPSARPSAAPVASTAPKVAAPPLNEAHYPWLPDSGLAPADSLQERFPDPDGYRRVKLKPDSFSAWLRGLPLLPIGTPVRTFRGDVLHAASDARIAAVVALDVGKADLQQCADAVTRLHAEWAWWRGKRNQSYTAAAGVPLPYERYARGERVVNRGAAISWHPQAEPSNDHAGFRAYLDTVFAWANTVSLARQAEPVAPEHVRPGDFFILPGNPGHAVIVLDIAVDSQRRVALLGQSFMPAQSFQVLRASTGSPWFALEAGRDVATPFWRPFPWSSLRRLD